MNLGSQGNEHWQLALPTLGPLVRLVGAHRQTQILHEGKRDGFASTSDKDD